MLNLPNSDFKPSKNKFNTLHEINTNLELSSSISLHNRHDQVVFQRCRIGHSNFTRYDYICVDELISPNNKQPNNQTNKQTKTKDIRLKFSLTLRHLLCF